MDYDKIFEAYYNLYRLEAETPATQDDEYVIGMRLANEAINRWENYDHTYWRELYKNITEADTGDATVTAGTNEYAAPDDFKQAGGHVRLRNSSGALSAKFPIIEPEQTQFQGDQAKYVYFTGNPADGYVLHFSPGIDTTLNGHTMDYVYYRTATKIDDGSSVPEMSDPYFVVHRMLANRFRGSRNPYASDAKADAENLLKTMQLQNISGTWADPWKVADNSGTVFGF